MIRKFLLIIEYHIIKERECNLISVSMGLLTLFSSFRRRFHTHFLIRADFLLRELVLLNWKREG